MDEADILLEVAGPEEIWVSRDPDLREGDKGGLILCSFRDEASGPCYAGFLVKLAGLGLRDCCFPLADRHDGLRTWGMGRGEMNRKKGAETTSR